MTQADTIKALETKLREKIGELHKLHREGKATLAQALLIYPEELEEAYALGLQMMASKKHESAAQTFSTLAMMSPYDGRFWRMAGLAFSKIQRAALAQMAFEMALLLLPNDLPSLTYRGEMFILLGRRNEAKRDLELVLNTGNASSADDAPFVKRAQGLVRYTSSTN